MHHQFKHIARSTPGMREVKYAALSSSTSTTTTAGSSTGIPRQIENEGDEELPQDFIPGDPLETGRFPLDRLIQTYTPEQIDDALAESESESETESGKTIKPVLIW